MARYEIMEIKHGRAAMLGFLHVIALHAGVRVPGYLSTSQNLKFEDVPAGCFASLEAVPTAGWLQIMVLTCMQEAGTGFASKPQTDDAEAGDIALDEEETPVVCVRVCLSLKAEARVARRGQKNCHQPWAQLPHYFVAFVADLAV